MNNHTYQQPFRNNGSLTKKMSEHPRHHYDRLVPNLSNLHCPKNGVDVDGRKLEGIKSIHPGRPSRFKEHLEENVSEISNVHKIPRKPVAHTEPLLKTHSGLSEKRELPRASPPPLLRKQAQHPTKKHFSNSIEPSRDLGGLGGARHYEGSEHSRNQRRYQEQSMVASESRDAGTQYYRHQTSSTRPLADMNERPRAQRYPTEPGRWQPDPEITLASILSDQQLITADQEPPPKKPGANWDVVRGLQKSKKKLLRSIKSSPKPKG